MSCRKGCRLGIGFDGNVERLWGWLHGLASGVADEESGSSIPSSPLQTPQVGRLEDKLKCAA